MDRYSVIQEFSVSNHEGRSFTDFGFCLYYDKCISAIYKPAVLHKHIETGHIAKNDSIAVENQVWENEVEGTISGVLKS